MNDELKKNKEERLLDLQLEHMEKEKKINDMSAKMTPYLIVYCIIGIIVIVVLVGNMN